jgi:methionine-rich copper-binding protein CopC
MRASRYFVAGAGFAVAVGFVSCGEDDPPIGLSDQTPPSIVSLIPANGTQNVASTTEIRARFSEEIDPGSVTASSFTLALDDVVVAGVHASAGDEATFTPANPLVDGARYVATVTTDVTDLAGNGLAGDVTWRFDTADPTAPTVASTSPLDGAEGVAPSAPVVVTFSEAVDAASVTAGSFTLTGPEGAVSGSRSVNGAVAVLTPDAALEADTPYTAGVTTDILDLAGNALSSPATWSFTTGAEGAPSVASVSPPDGATGVSTLVDIVVTFTEAVDPSSVTESSFVVETAGAPATGGGIAGTIEVNGAVATFTPQDRLASGVAHGVRVTTDVRDLDGVPLDTAFASSFTTRDDVAPTVVSVSPSVGAIDVPINTDVVAIFSEPIDAATVDASSFSVQGPLGVAVAGTYTLAGAEVRFDPDVDLDGQVEYAASIGVGVRDLAGNSLADPFAWTFSTADADLPFVVSTVPGDGATDVPVSGTVSATFSEALDPTSVTAESFSLEDFDGGPVPGVVSVSGPVAEFDPDTDLAEETDYVVRLTTDIRDAAGNAMAAPYGWTFTTEDATPPIVVATTPAHGSTEVSPTITLSVEFSEVVDPASVNFSSFTVAETGGAAVLGFVGVDGMTATFAPTAPLDSETEYTARVTTSITDVAGNSLAEDVEWEFRTADAIAPFVNSTSPVGGATDVSIAPVVTATFSENIDPATVTGGSFTLESAGGSVAATTNVVGAVVTLTPTSALSGPTLYTARLSTAIQDLAGNGLAAPFVWSFTTVDVSGPVVVSTTPTSNAIGVSPAVTLFIEFSEPIAPATVTAGSVTLSEVGGGSVSGMVSVSGSTVIFEPATELASSTEYAAGVTTAITDLAGNPLDAGFGWSFTVADVVPPEVTAVTPLDGAVDVPVEALITATFSETISLLSITPTSFSLRVSGGGEVGAVPGVSGNVATLDPIVDLPDGTVLIARLTTAVTDLSGNGLTSDQEWSFTTVDLTGPAVASTDPGGGAIGVDPAITLAVEFSESIDTATITDTSFTLERSGGGAVAGTVAASTPTSATFDPDVDLESLAVYTARLTTAITDALGNPMASEFSWSFTIADVEGPAVIGTVPAADAVGVDTDVVILALFSETVDPSSVTPSTFLVEAEGGGGIAGVIDVAIDVVRFTPNEDLAAGVTYTVTLTTGVTDAAGNPLAADFEWSFATAEPPDTDPPSVQATTPADGATVPAPTSIVVTMSEAIAPASVTAGTFGVRTDGLSVTGTIDVTGSELTFTPTDPLAGNWRYTIGVTTGVTDLAGNPLAADFTATFATSPASGPVVVNAATGNRYRVLEVGPISWTEARDEASFLAHLGRRGRLATVTSAEEEQGLRDAGVDLVGLWIGGYQGALVVEPDGGWRWVDADDAWGYENWRAGSPDDPSGLEDFLRYDALGEGWIDEVEDGADARGYLVEFDFVPPQVVTRDPADGAIAVAADAVVTIGFSERLDPSTLTALTVQILESGVTPVPTLIDPAGNPTVMVTPLAPLLPSTSYTVRVSTGVTDEAGNGVELDDTWTFTTGP